MKNKLTLIIISIVCVMLFMTACEESVHDEPAKAPDIVVTVGEVGEGMVVEEIPVHVTLDGQPVDCSTEWIIYYEEDYDYLDGFDQIPANYWGRVDVYYDLPEDVVLDDIPICVEAVNGIDDGTGDLGNNSVWTHIQFDLRKNTEILISVGEIKAGDLVRTIPVSVQINGEEVESRTEWVIYSEEDYDYLDHSATIPANYWGRLDIYYTLPKDIPSDYPEVIIDAPGGLYDGTGDVGVDSEGCVEAWSHIQYDFRNEESTKETEETVKQSESKTPDMKPEPPKTEPETKPHVHSWKVNESESVAASCDTNGWKQYDCKGCSEIYREDLPAYGHQWSSKVIKEPTCTESGVRQYSCSNCKWSYDEAISATGHSMSSETTNPSSCTGQGSGVYRCGICGYEESYSISATGHSWGAAYSSGGRYHTRTCVACGETQEESHVFESGGVRCLVCGADIIN